MVNKHLEICASLSIREMQMKTTKRYHYASITMAKIKKMSALTVDKDLEKLDYSYFVGEMLHLLWERDWQFLKKLTMQSSSCAPGHLSLRNGDLMFV